MGSDKTTESLESKQFVKHDDSGRYSLGEVERPVSKADLLRIMECPVCNEFPVPPIFSCVRGHFTCNSCIKLLDNCSLCESPFTDVRNFALESIIESSKFKCRNAHLGCPAVVSGAELSSHVEECIFRPLECTEPDCLKSSLSPREYFHHMMECHVVGGSTSRALICGKAETTVKQSEESGDYPPFFITLKLRQREEATFVILTKRHKTFTCWWAACLEPQFLHNFDVRLSLQSHADNDSLSVKWTLPLQPIWKSFDEIRDTGRCAVLPGTNLIPFYAEDSSWNLKVEIMQKKKANGRLLDYFKHYYPLLVLTFVGVFAVLSSLFIEYGLSWFDSLKRFEHGLNYSDPSRTNIDEHLDSNENDNYFGYRGFYYKSDNK